MLCVELFGSGGWEVCENVAVIGRFILFVFFIEGVRRIMAKDTTVAELGGAVASGRGAVGYR